MLFPNSAYLFLLRGHQYGGLLAIYLDNLMWSFSVVGFLMLRESDDGFASPQAEVSGRGNLIVRLTPDTTPLALSVRPHCPEKACVVLRVRGCPSLSGRRPIQSAH